MTQDAGVKAVSTGRLWPKREKRLRKLYGA